MSESIKPGQYQIHYGEKRAFVDSSDVQVVRTGQLQRVVVGPEENSLQNQPNFNIKTNTDGNYTITDCSGRSLVVKDDELFASQAPPAEQPAEAWRIVQHRAGDGSPMLYT